jgi:hypothetical protein
MARSVSTIPKTSSKPASDSKAVSSEKAGKKESKPKAAAPVESLAIEASAPEIKSKKASKPKGEKKVPVEPVVSEPVLVEAVSNNAALGEAVSNNAAPVEPGVSTNKLNDSIYDVIQSIRLLETNMRLLRASCKSILYASKKECHSSRKFIKAKKEAAQLVEGSVYKTDCQKYTEQVGQMAKSIVSDMSAIKSKIGKFSSLHSEQAKLVRKQKKESRKRTPPAASIQPVRVDAKISKFMGTEEGVRLSRHDVFTAIRAHISDHQCYVPGFGKKYIQPDATLAPLFSEVPDDKKLSITHFNMQKYLKKYFTKEPVAA